MLVFFHFILFQLLQSCCSAFMLQVFACLWCNTFNCTVFCCFCSVSVFVCLFIITGLLSILMLLFFFLHRFYSFDWICCCVCYFGYFQQKKKKFTTNLKNFTRNFFFQDLFFCLVFLFIFFKFYIATTSSVLFILS